MDNSVSSRFACNKVIGFDISEIKDIIGRFWKQKELPEKEDQWSAETTDCEAHFRNTFRFDDSSDRFIV